MSNKQGGDNLCFVQSIKSQENFICANNKRKITTTTNRHCWIGSSPKIVFYSDSIPIKVFQSSVYRVPYRILLKTKQKKFISFNKVFFGGDKIRILRHCHLHQQRQISFVFIYLSPLVLILFYPADADSGKCVNSCVSHVRHCPRAFASRFSSIPK